VIVVRNRCNVPWHSHLVDI